MSYYFEKLSTSSKLMLIGKIAIDFILESKEIYDRELQIKLKNDDGNCGGCIP